MEVIIIEEHFIKVFNYFICFDSVLKNQMDELVIV